MYVLNLIDNSNWKFTRSGQKASLWNWYKWGAWNIQWWGRVRSTHHRLGMSSITCAARYTSHQTLNYIYDCVTSQPPWDFPCGLTEPHSSRPHCIYHKPHLCHRCQHNNMPPFLFARFILSQCDSPISHIGSKSWTRTEKQQLLDFISFGFAELTVTLLLHCWTRPGARLNYCPGGI